MSEKARTIAVHSTLAATAICYATKFIAIYSVPSLHAQPRFWFKLAKYAFVAVAPEVMIVAAIGLIAWAFAFVVRSKFAGWVIVVALIWIYSCIVVVNLASVEIARIFGTPLSLGLIYYSDILGSQHGRTAVLSWIPAQVWTAIAVSVLIALVVPLLLSRLPRGLTNLGLISVATVAAIITFFDVSLGAYELGDVYKTSNTASFLKSAR